MLVSEINGDSSVEDVVLAFPDAVSYLRDRHDLRVICCGAPLWVSLRDLAENKGLDSNTVVNGLREHLRVEVAADR